MSSTSLRPRPLAMTIDALSFDDPAHYNAPDTDQLIFGPLDLEDGPAIAASNVGYGWDSFSDVDTDIKPSYPFPSFSPMTHYELVHGHSANYFDSNTMYSPVDESVNSNMDDLATWINDPDLSTGIHPPSSPISIPSPTETNISGSSSFMPYHDHSPFSPSAAFSPTSFAALHPLPRSVSPQSSSYDDIRTRPRVHSVVSPREMSVQTPPWAAHLWDASSAIRTQSMVRPSVRHSPLSDAATLRQRIPIRRGSISSGQQMSSSAPCPTIDMRANGTPRSFSRRADSIVASDDPDATIRRKKREDTPTSTIPKAPDIR